MNVHRQNSYFFINFDMKCAFGYVEYIIDGAFELIFNVGMLKIEQVCINDVDVEFEVKNRSKSQNTRENVFEKNMYQNYIDHKNTLTVVTKNTKNRVRIHFIPNVKFYSSILYKEKHEEAFGCNSKTVLFPYLDGMSEFTIMYVIPPDYSVISPGQVINVIEHSEYIVHTYNVRTLPENISFVVGTFEAYEISAVKTLYLPCYLVYFDLKSDFATVQKFLDGFLSIDQPINLVIVFSMFEKSVISSGIAILPFSEYPRVESIEHNFLFKEALSLIVGTQFFSDIHFEKEDLWLKNGLIGYVADQILKHLLGNNEFLFRLKTNINAIVKEDRMHAPLYSTKRTIYSYSSKFSVTKATVFMHILENNTSIAFMQKIIKNIVNRRAISTHEFIALVRDITGKDLKNEKIIFKNTSTTFTGEISIDLKKNQVRVSFNGPVNTVLQSHEIEGVYEHRIRRELTYTYHNRRKKDEDSVLFIKIDPYITQLNTYKLILKSNMYNNLTRDNNITSQIDGIKYVDEAELERLLYDTHVNYRVKLLAMHFLGINSIFSFFVKKFCIQGSTIIKPNSFTILNYKLLMGVVEVLSFFDPNVRRTVNKKSVSVGAIIKAFYYNILRYNDNSLNVFDDSAFISRIIQHLSFMMTCLKDYQEEEAHDDVCTDVIMSDDDHMCDLDDMDDSAALKSTNQLDELHTDEDEIMSSANECEEIYIDMIERYRMKDLIFPSNGNMITRAVLYFYGRLDLHGIINLDINYLLLLLKPTNFIKVRCIAAELVILKSILDDNVLNNQFSDVLKTMFDIDTRNNKAVVNAILNMLLDMEEMIQLVVYKALLNFLSCAIYNSLTKSKLNKVTFYTRLKHVEDCEIRDKILEIIYFLENADVELQIKNQLEHELSSSNSDAIFVPRMVFRPIVNLKVKLKLGKIKKNIIVRKIVPSQERNGRIKLKVGKSTMNKPKKSVKRIKLDTKNKGSDAVSCFDLVGNIKRTVFCFTDDALVLDIIKKFDINIHFDSEVCAEANLRAYLTDIFLNENMSSKHYVCAKNAYDELERSKLEIPIENKYFTSLTPDEKNRIKVLLDSLIIPNFTRPKNYKDIVRKSKTIYSLKKKLDGVVLLEVIKSEIYDFLNKCMYFTLKNDFNQGLLLALLDSLPENKDVDLYASLIDCFEILKAKKTSAEFISKVSVDGYDDIVKQPMYIELIIEKIQTKQYRTISDIQKDVELISTNAMLFNGSNSVYASDSKLLVKWFKRIVGGMLGDLYNDVD